MITKNDCVLLLTELQDKGVNVKPYISKLMSTSDLNLDVLKFLNSQRELDVNAFYNMIRMNYNKKKSSLYINIMKEIDNPADVLTTLSAMLTQIILYSNKLENPERFLSHVRAKEISQVLSNYFTRFDITNAVRLLRIIKCDIKALESIRE